jgi:hypothetical protein
MRVRWKSCENSQGFNIRKGFKSMVFWITYHTIPKEGQVNELSREIKLFVLIMQDINENNKYCLFTIA